MAGDIAVVVVNWNGGVHTTSCLDSLAAGTVLPRVIVVDNGSTDGSLEKAKHHPVVAEVIAMGRNTGYTGGNNAGIRRALADTCRFICVLNNDVVLEPDALERLRSHLGATGAPIALCPDIRYYERPTESWFAGGIVEAGYPRHLQKAELAAKSRRHVLRESDFLTGCCLIAPRGVWERVGLFDERYFLLFEDCDWSVRARAAGVRLQVALDSVVLHKVSRSFQSCAVSRLGAFYYARNGMLYTTRYQRRHAPRFCLRHICRPAARAFLRHREAKPQRKFLLFGLLAFAIARFGRAPRWIESLADRP
ncbi:MAG: glycosyltransferase family 2 protein [Chloroflexi bacterium]|nr:MAG: glycosyltransferase family 2 protein [Chloroflexota bacterium]